jgi:hypothetical protein
MENIMKAIKIAAFGVAALVLSGSVYAACFGWTLVGQKSISINERLCIYEKSGVQQNIIVSGFCPFSPPGC